MKLLVQHIILALVSIVSYSFANGTEINAKEYYRRINLAELAICDRDFKQACRHYDEAFKINSKNAFYEDVFNAFCASMDAYEYNAAKRYYSQLISLNLDTSHSAKLIQSYSGDALGVLKKIILEAPAPAAVKENILQNTIKNMVKHDQDVRRHFDEINQGDYMVDSVYSVDYNNALSLLKIINTYGIPSEKVLRATDYTLIIYHNTHVLPAKGKAHLFDSLLYRGIWNFQFDARKFAHILHISPTKRYHKYDSVMLALPFIIEGCLYKEKIYPEYYDDTSELIMNANRAKIGLESLDDYRKKVITTNSNDAGILEKYLIGKNITVMGVESIERLQHWLNTNGKNGTALKSIENFKLHKPIMPPFNVRNLGSTFMLGQRNLQNRLDWYQNIDKSMYFGNVKYAKDWNNRRPPLKRGYYAVLVENPDEDLKTENGRDNKAKFVQGYTFLIMDGWFISPYGTLRQIEEMYDKDGYLVNLQANVDTAFYRTINYYISRPSHYHEKTDTVTYLSYIIPLKKRVYAWQKQGYMLEIVVQDKISTNGKKYVTAVLNMTDVNKNTVYLKRKAARYNIISNEFEKR